VQRPASTESLLHQGGPVDQDRLSLSILAASSPTAFPVRTASKAAGAAGRPFSDLALIPSSQYSSTIVKPLRSARR
jgi:hypothetical protein